MLSIYILILATTTTTTDVVGLDGVGGAVGNVGDPIDDDAIPNAGVGDVTILFVEVVVPNMALAANGVASLDLLNTFPDPFEASAAVTLDEIIRSSCSGVVGIQLQRLSRCLMKMPVAGNMSLVMILILILSFD